MYLWYRVLKLHKINPSHGNLKISSLKNRRFLEFEKYLLSLLDFSYDKQQQGLKIIHIVLEESI